MFFFLSDRQSWSNFKISSRFDKYIIKEDILSKNQISDSHIFPTNIHRKSPLQILALDLQTEDIPGNTAFPDFFMRSDDAKITSQTSQFHDHIKIFPIAAIFRAADPFFNSRAILRIFIKIQIAIWVHRGSMNR